MALIVSTIVSTYVHAESLEISGTASARAELTAHIMGTYLSEGTAAITKKASNKVHVFGVTSCARTSEEVYLYLYLERKVDGNYGTYKSWRFKTEDADFLQKGINVTVTPGYYYRVRGYHAAVSNGTKESTSTLTDGILID